MAKPRGRATTEEGDGKTSPASSVKADDLRSVLAKSFGAEAVPDALAVQQVDVYPTGLVSLDRAIGVGGYAKGRLHYISGPTHSGKTALALLGVASIQRAKPDSICAIIDTEQAYSQSLAEIVGVDTDPARFIVVRPETAEQACMAALNLMGLETKDDGRTWKRVRGSIDAIIFDSWAGSATEEVGLATLARVGSHWMPKMSLEINRSKVVFFLINHIRYKPGVMFGNPEYEPGGEAVKHALTTRIQVHAVGEKQKNSVGEQIGHQIKIYIAKNKLAPPFKTVYAMLNYFSGFDQLADAFMVLEQKGIDLRETPGGNILKFACNDIVIRENGKDKFLDALRGDPDAAEAFVHFAQKDIDSAA